MVHFGAVVCDGIFFVAENLVLLSRRSIPALFYVLLVSSLNIYDRVFLAIKMIKCK